MWYIQQNLCAFPLFDCVKQFCPACLHSFHIFFFSQLGIWMNVFPLTFILNPSTPYPNLNFHHCTLHFLPLHFPNPPCPPHSHFWLLSQLYILYHNQLPPFQNVVESIARSSFRTTGFYLWCNKDAPQSGVWVFLLISLIFLSHVGGLLYLSIWVVSSPLHQAKLMFGFPEWVKSVFYRYVLWQQHYNVVLCLNLHIGL